jgi:hypothetical protein
MISHELSDQKPQIRVQASQRRCCQALVLYLTIRLRWSDYVLVSLISEQPSESLPYVDSCTVAVGDGSAGSGVLHSGVMRVCAASKQARLDSVGVALSHHPSLQGPDV